jgi:hypothetical protein
VTVLRDDVRDPFAVDDERLDVSDGARRTDETIVGAICFACAKRSRTRDAPTPTIISMNSEADIEKNGRLARDRARTASSSVAT